MFTYIYIYIVFHQSFLTTAHLNIQNVNIPAGFQKHHRYPPVGHLESAYPFCPSPIAKFLPVSWREFMGRKTH